MMYEGVVPTSIVSLDVLHQYLASEDVLAGRSPISKPNVQQLCEAWAALQGYRRREALVLSPLRPGLILAWAGTCLFPSTRPATVSGDPSMAASKQDVGISGVSTRACTPLLQQDEAGQVGPPGDTSIMLLGPLGITPIHMSEEYDGGLPPYEVSARNSMQVWLGEVFHGGKSSGIKVALKLYDERVLSPEVNRASFHEGEVRYVPGMESGMTLAANDAAAFWKLQSLQGSVVPFSYGHYKFALPDCKDECIGLVTEYIHDETCPSLIYRTLKKDKEAGLAFGIEQAQLALTCLRAMADAGVKLEETDVLSVKYSNLSKCPVFIGLGPSTPCDSHKGLQFDNPYSEAVAGALELSEDGEDVLEVLEAMDAVFR